MEKGIDQFIRLIKKNSKNDEIIYNFLKELLQKEAYDSKGWYTQEYKQLIDNYIEKGWKNNEN